MAYHKVDSLTWEDRDGNRLVYALKTVRVVDGKIVSGTLRRFNYRKSGWQAETIAFPVPCRSGYHSYANIRNASSFPPYTSNDEIWLVRVKNPTVPQHDGKTAAQNIKFIGRVMGHETWRALRTAERASERPARDAAAEALHGNAALSQVERRAAVGAVVERRRRTLWSTYLNFALRSRHWDAVAASWHDNTVTVDQLIGADPLYQGFTPDIGGEVPVEHLTQFSDGQRAALRHLFDLNNA